MKKYLFIALWAVVAAGCNKSSFYDTNDKIQYKVGDIYSENGKEGIVFYVADNGARGKIVSIDETQCQWSIEEINTGATDENDGMENMKKIQSISGWREKYPAFAWCADKGEGWYLPAINELETIYDLNILKDNYYLSSTEEAKYDYERARGVSMLDGRTYYYRKLSTCYVRAVSAF